MQILTLFVASVSNLIDVVTRILAAFKIAKSWQVLDVGWSLS